jgi:hypothetical protein
VSTIGKREENLTMVLNSLQPLAIGITSLCALLPCTGPYFAKCPSIASSFSLEGQNIVRSFTSEVKDTLKFFFREIWTVTLTLGSLFTLTPNFNLKFYYSKSEEILLNQGYKMLKLSSIVSNVQDSKLL